MEEIILFLIIGTFIIDFIYIERKDRDEEINKIIAKNNADINMNCNHNISEKEVYDKSDVSIEPSEQKAMDKEEINEEEIITDEIDEGSVNQYIDNQEEFECEMCFKKISEEEYELYDGMCEDCFMDVHIDSDGNYHDEELF